MIIFPMDTDIGSILYYCSRPRCTHCGATADVEELQGTSKSMVTFLTCDINCSNQGKCFFVNTIKLVETKKLGLNPMLNNR